MTTTRPTPATAPQAATRTSPADGGWPAVWGALEGYVASAAADHRSLDPRYLNDFMRDLKARYITEPIEKEKTVEKQTCMTCGGEGFTDNNEDPQERAPWSFWANLPPGSDMAVRLGLVKRIPCETCGGTGEVS